MSDQVFYLFSAVLLGLVLGALFMYFATGANKDSDQTIKELEKKLNNYQEDVSNHFEETADLVDELTNSYKKVFDHLSKSARKLMTKEQIQHQIEKRKGNKVTLEFLTEEILEDQPETEPPPKQERQEYVDEQVENQAEEGEIAEEDSTIVEDVVEVETQENTDEKIDEKIDLEHEVKMREKYIYT